MSPREDSPLIHHSSSNNQVDLSDNYGNGETLEESQVSLKTRPSKSWLVYIAVAGILMGLCGTGIHSHNKKSTTAGTRSSLSYSGTVESVIRQELLALNISIEGQVFFRNDSDDESSSSSSASSSLSFQQAARVWRQDLKPPLAVIEVATEQDVQLSVPILAQLRADFGVPFRIRSGGHNKAGFSTVADGIVLSLKRMNQRTIITSADSIDFDIDVSDGGDGAVATIQPGATVENVLDSFLSHKQDGYAGAIGQCGKVAEGGWVLGGGVGFMARLLGLGIDNVLEFRVVLANGTVAVCNDEQHADLFWALRGAGSGNYGVVTAMTYKLHTGVPDKQLFQKVIMPIAEMGDFLFRLGALNTDREFFVVFGGRKGDTAAAYMSWFTAVEPSVVDGGDSLESNAMIGNRHFDQAIRPILPPGAIIPPVDNATEGAYETFLWAESTHELFDQGYGTSVYAAQPWQGFLLPVNNTKEVWESIMDIMAAGMQAAPDLGPHIELWGGAISDIDVNQTAFPYRDAVYNVGVLLVVQDKDDTADQRFHEQVASVNAWWPQVAEFLTGSYLNYPMNSLRSEEYPRLYWGEHLERLVDVKQRYDPDNVFAYEQSVPLMVLDG